MPDGVLPSELCCSYPFKFCSNCRAVKKSGKRHKLCQEHLEKAKRHHRWPVTRRKGIAARLSGNRDSSAPPPTTTQSSEHQLSFRDISDLLDDDAPLHVECKEDDLKAVEALLSD